MSVIKGCAASRGCSKRSHYFSRFSNINCLFFSKLLEKPFSCFKYEISFSRELSQKDMRLILVKKFILDRFGETLLSLPPQPNEPKILYASSVIPQEYLVRRQ